MATSYFSGGLAQQPANVMNGSQIYQRFVPYMLNVHVDPSVLFPRQVSHTLHGAMFCYNQSMFRFWAALRW